MASTTPPAAAFNRCVAKFTRFARCKLITSHACVSHARTYTAHAYVYTRTRDDALRIFSPSRTDQATYFYAPTLLPFVNRVIIIGRFSLLRDSTGIGDAWNTRFVPFAIVRDTDTRSSFGQHEDPVDAANGFRIKDGSMSMPVTGWAEKMKGGSGCRPRTCSQNSISTQLSLGLWWPSCVYHTHYVHRGIAPTSQFISRKQSEPTTGILISISFVFQRFHELLCFVVSVEAAPIWRKIWEN